MSKHTPVEYFGKPVEAHEEYIVTGAVILAAHAARAVLYADDTTPDARRDMANHLDAVLADPVFRIGGGAA